MGLVARGQQPVALMVWAVAQRAADPEQVPAPVQPDRRPPSAPQGARLQLLCRWGLQAALPLKRQWAPRCRLRVRQLQGGWRAGEPLWLGPGLLLAADKRRRPG